MTIYVIGEPGTGMVKIGTTIQPVEARLRQIRRDGPFPRAVDPDRMKVLYQTSGGERLERAIQRHFAPFRVRERWAGIEWFALDPELAPWQVARAIIDIRFAHNVTSQRRRTVPTFSPIALF